MTSRYVKRRYTLHKAILLDQEKVILNAPDLYFSTISQKRGKRPFVSTLSPDLLYVLLISEAIKGLIFHIRKSQLKIWFYSIFSHDQVFYGNQDSDTIVYNVLNPPITARYIRISPVEWHNHISMRMEIYGCFGNVQ